MLLLSSNYSSPLGHHVTGLLGHADCDLEGRVTGIGALGVGTGGQPLFHLGLQSGVCVFGENLLGHHSALVVHEPGLNQQALCGTFHIVLGLLWLRFARLQIGQILLSDATLAHTLLQYPDLLCHIVGLDGRQIKLDSKRGRDRNRERVFGYHQESRQTAEQKSQCESCPHFACLPVAVALNESVIWNCIFILNTQLSNAGYAR